MKEQELQELKDKLEQAQKALDDYLNEPELAVDTPLLVWDKSETDQSKRYFSHFKNGKVYCFANGSNSYNNSDKTLGWNNYKIDHNAPPIIGWLPIDENVKDAELYLVKENAIGYLVVSKLGLKPYKGQYIVLK